MSLENFNLEKGLFHAPDGNNGSGGESEEVTTPEQEAAIIERYGVDNGTHTIVIDNDGAVVGEKPNE